MFKILFAALIALHAPSAFAGKEVGNGGDLCENRIQEIRDDLKSWIQQGGHKSLELPSGLDGSAYKTAMLRQIPAAVVSCTDRVIKVRGVEKMCVNKSGGRKPSIVCNRKAFNASGAQEQYVLVHHEYAGLAGLETNHDEASEYKISNQLSAYLVVRKVAKLALEKRPVQPPNELRKNFDAFVGNYRILECDVRQNKERPDRHHKCESKYLQLYYSAQYFPPAQPGESDKDLKLVANFTNAIDVPTTMANLAYETSYDDMIYTTYPGSQGCTSEIHGFVLSTSLKERDGKVYLEDTFTWPDQSKKYLFRATSAVLEKIN